MTWRRRGAWLRGGSPAAREKAWGRTAPEPGREQGLSLSCLEQAAALTRPTSWSSPAVSCGQLAPGLFMSPGRGWAVRLISPAGPSHCSLVLAMWNLEFKDQLCP